MTLQLWNSIEDTINININIMIIRPLCELEQYQSMVMPYTTLHRHALEYTLNISNVIWLQRLWGGQVLNSAVAPEGMVGFFPY